MISKQKVPSSTPGIRAEINEVGGEEEEEERERRKWLKRKEDR